MQMGARLEVEPQFRSWCILQHTKYKPLKFPHTKPHYYGPYSQGVSHALEKLVSYSFVSETQTPGIIFGGYRYKLTDDSIKTIARINDEYSNEYNEIKKFVKRCKDLCKLDISQLSYASKILYMTDSKSGQADALSFEDAVKDAKNLGWDVSPGDVERGANLLKELKLVKIQQN